MNNIKKIILRVFFLFEIIIFTVLYLFGSHGLQALNNLEKKNTGLKKELNILEKEVETLAKQLNEWNNCLFYKEQIAREQLQMAHPHEELYLCS
jgi:cell division protein FtsB